MHCCTSVRRRVAAAERLSIAQLEADAAELRRKNDALTAARREAEARVARFRAEADEQIDGIDAVEAHRMEEVPKIQMQIALYAKVVGIKWDYDESVGGMLKGEVVSSNRVFGSMLDFGCWIRLFGDSRNIELD